MFLSNVTSCSTVSDGSSPQICPATATSYEVLEPRDLLANLGSLQGNVYLDTNADGSYSANVDAGIPGIVVTLTGTSSVVGKSEPQQVSLRAITGADGHFKFSGLGAGSFTISQTSFLPGLTALSPPEYPREAYQGTRSHYRMLRTILLGTGYNFGKKYISSTTCRNDSSKL